MLKASLAASLVSLWILRVTRVSLASFENILCSSLIEIVGDGDDSFVTIASTYSTLEIALGIELGVEAGSKLSS